jgi:hypothetical protein
MASNEAIAVEKLDPNKDYTVNELMKCTIPILHMLCEELELPKKRKKEDIVFELLHNQKARSSSSRQKKTVLILFRLFRGGCSCSYSCFYS